MKTETISIFDQTYVAACKIRDVMNATLPPNNQVEVRHVLSTAVGMGIGGIVQGVGSGYGEGEAVMLGEYVRNACAQQAQSNYQNALHQQMQGMQGLGSFAQQAGNNKNRAIPLTPVVQPPKEKSMFKEVVTDIKSFVLEHRGIIYFVVIALVIDHFFFNGAFKARLQAMADKMVTKVEGKIQ